MAASSSSSTAPGVRRGAVYLVGAGPGAVGLLTVRAVEVLSQCDVVLHDRLVPMEVVRLASPTAEVRYVGKDAGVATAEMKVHQDDISGQLVKLAQEGRSVCRLKGGDPMIYGRAGEEMEVLAAASVPYEVVPAVTAALSAAADARIPLTFRKLATSLRVHTLNASTTRDKAFDWAQFAAPSTTYALYMGLGVLQDTCTRMKEAGVSGSTPMAVIDRSSLPSMQVVAGTVDTLPGLVSGRSDLEGPALVLLGDVVALRERLGACAAKAPEAADAPEAAAADGAVSAVSESAEAAALASAVASLPRLGRSALEDLRSRIDAMLQKGCDAADEVDASNKRTRTES